MILVLIGLAALGAYLNVDGSMFVPAAINAVASLWSNGVMANFGGDPQSAPDWAARVSMVTTLAAIVFIVIGVVGG